MAVWKERGVKGEVGSEESEYKDEEESSLY